MKRYYICDILGDGSYGNPYRPSVADQNVAWVGAIPTNPDTGAPLFTWTLALVASDDHTKLRNKPGIAPLPDFPLDGKVSAINAATVALMKAAVQARGIPASIVDGKDGYREVIRAIGTRLQSDFSEDKFDIADV
jgi:hypothetical protein